MNSDKEIKPIIKFNGAKGAILCNKCTVIIKTHLTKDEFRGKTNILYCESCKEKLNSEYQSED